MAAPLFLSLALALAPSAAGAGAARRIQEPAPPGAWRMVRLDLEVVVDDVRGALDVSGTMRLVLEGGSSGGPVLGVNARDAAEHFVEVDAPAGWKVALDGRYREVTRLATVTAPASLEAGAEVELGFALEGLDKSEGVQAGEGFALAGWTSAWYPGPLPPTEEARERAGLAELLSAPGTTRLHLPAGWTSISNGTRVESGDEEGGRLETWRVERGVARSFAAGPYRVARHELRSDDGVTREVSVYALTLDPAALQEQAETLARAVAALVARFGPYPYDSYAIAEVPKGRVSFYGSSEQGFVLATTDAFHVAGGNLALFAHEAGHAWWGNALGGRGPGSILLEESLAQYGAVVAIEALEGRAAATDFLRFSRTGYASDQCARGYFELWRAGHDEPLAELEGGAWDHTLSDAKGHWVFHMLRRRVGDERFFATLRSFATDRTRKTWTVADLRAAFVAAAPEAGLERFFQQWLERTGAPILEHEVRRATGGGWELVVRQVQPGEPYDLRLDVDVTLPAGPRRQNVELSEREQRFPLEVADEGGAAPAITLDPDHALLLWEPAYGPRPTD